MLTLTSEQKAAERKWIIDRLRRSFDPQSFEVSPATGLPGVIAGPQPNNPFVAFQRRVGRATCDRWSRGDRAALIPFRDQYYRELCSDYLGTQLPGNPTTETTIPLGQCVGIQYSMSIQAECNRVRCPVSSGTAALLTLTGSGTLLGPISNLRFNSISEGNCGSNANEILVTSGNPDGSITEKLFRNGFSTSRADLKMENPRFTSVVITRVDGQPDDCGDPVVVFDPGEPNPTPDPNPGPIGGPTGYPFPGFDIEINPDGTIGITFGDGSEPVTIDPTEGTQTTDGQLEPGDIGTPSTPEPVAGGDTAEGEAPEGKVIGALQIDISSVATGAREFFPGLWRAVAYIFMGTEDGLAIHPDGAILESGQLVFPQKDNLTHWSVGPNFGYNLIVTPFYI